jgi:hypothetical protein
MRYVTLEPGRLTNLQCARCQDMTQHTLDEGDDGKDHWFCLCGMATDGKDRQHVSTEGEVV